MQSNNRWTFKNAFSPKNSVLCILGPQAEDTKYILQLITKDELLAYKSN